jgi:hypothetical protein
MLRHDAKNKLKGYWGEGGKGGGGREIFFSFFPGSQCVPPMFPLSS